MSPKTVDVVVTRGFDHPASRVYDAWLGVDVAERFLFATEGGTRIHAEMNGAIGGKFRFTERRTKDDGTTWDADHVGVILEATRPHRIVFSFCAGEAPCAYDEAAATRVTITIEARSAGGSTLTLRHEGIPIEHADRAEGGWKRTLDGLERALAH